MAGEDQQAQAYLQIILQAAVIPLARDLMMLTAKVVGIGAKGVAKGVAKGGRAAVGAAANALPAMGKYGWVSGRRFQALNARNETALELVPKGMLRSDLAELGRACKKLGVTFSVARINGQTAIQFAAKDKQTIARALTMLHHEYVPQQDARSADMATEDVEVRSGHPLLMVCSPAYAAMLPAGDERPDLSFEAYGQRFEPEAFADDGVTPTAWSARVCGDGLVAVVHAAADGSWKVTSVAGATLVTPGGQPCVGVAPEAIGTDVMGAVLAGTCVARYMTNREALKQDIMHPMQPEAKAAKASPRSAEVTQQSHAALVRSRREAPSAPRPQRPALPHAGR